MAQLEKANKTIISSFEGEYRFLSNFYESPIKFQRYIYKTVEHFYQASKAITLSDKILVILCQTPGQAKRFGNKIECTPNWDEIKYSIMLTGVILKFEQNPELRAKLIETFPKHLIEGNHWHDNYWGMCFCASCRGNTIAFNNLGHILERVRRNCHNQYMRRSES